MTEVRRKQLPEILRAGDFQKVAIGSISGPVVWTMREAWMPSPCTCAIVGRPSCQRHQRGYALDQAMRAGSGAGENFDIYGRFPKGFLHHVYRHRWLGDVRPDEVLHVCSGTLSETEHWTIDRRRVARPRVLADGTALPFREASFKAVMLDPPYSDEYARTFYGTAYPRPSHLLAEAARVVKPGGRIGFLHVVVPFTPADCRMVNVYGITTGTGYRIRALTVFEREQDALPLEAM